MGILPADVVLPPGSEEVLAHPVLERARIEKRDQTRYLERLDVCLAMSEKEVAGVSFATMDGRLDHLDFRGLDGRSHRWCKDLFEYYWDRTEELPRE